MCDFKILRFSPDISPVKKVRGVMGVTCSMHLKLKSSQRILIGKLNEILKVDDRIILKNALKEVGRL
jgi:3-hydroxymyristoyl/3-hydroxydecanoyl-(acyl carrier protein) dehydratase